MATFKDLILALGSVVQDDELTAIAGASNISEAELTDEGLTRIKEKLGGFLTVESAMNNSEIKDKFKAELYPVHKKTFLGNIDKHLSDNVKVLFGDEKLAELLAVESTEDKIKRLVEWTHVLKKSKSKDEDSQKTIEGYKTQLEKAQSDHEDILKKKDSEIVGLKNGHNQALVKSEFNRLVNGYELAEAYKEDEFRKLVVDGVFTKLNADATLKLHPDLGTISMYDKKDPNLELYDGSKRVEIKPWLDTAMSPYLPKKPGEKEKPRFPNEKPQFQQVGNLSALGEDLRQQREDGK